MVLIAVASQYPGTASTDVCDKAIVYAKKQYKKLEFLQADGHTIPLPKQSQDLVMCNEVLEHVVDPMLVLSEIKRVMKRDGYAIIEMDSGNWMFKLVWHWWTHMRHGVWEDAHIQIFNEKKLELQIRKSGFEIINKRF
jgi:ubiquinone/menaquinone biosynthesis C-methylase UbiE